MRHRQSRYIIGAWLLLVVTLWLPDGAARAATAELVDYHAGKDESCHMGVTPQDQPHEVVAKLVRLLLVIDYYGAGDTELWCTLVVVPNAAAESQVLRFSASSRKCRRILDAAPRRTLRLEVFRDHVCDLDFVGEPAE